MLDFVLKEHRKSLGLFEVGRVLPQVKRRMVGPFIFFDHMGPVDFAPGIPREMDVRPHPHIGLATVTYLFDGEITHRDSTGVEIGIAPGEVNWMVAGQGITHSERFEALRRHGGRMDGIQTWVALPTEHEETAPSFTHTTARQITSFTDKGLTGRLIAGQAYGVKADVATFSPMFYAHLLLADGTACELPPEYPERAAYVASGQVSYDGQTYGVGEMLVFRPGPTGALRAIGEASLMLLGGTPVGERYIEWNFVSSSRERIEQAKADWRAGRMKLPDLDNAEFIPLP
jgi:redox-sensitive bicupin YhaK (pirin superfamily)